MNISWDADKYADDFSFVHKYGEDVLSLIDAPKGSDVIDLGCGNGALSAKLDSMGYNVMGIDSSEEMLRLAKKVYPKIKFVNADAAAFKLSQKADAMFSNAVFHWIDTGKQTALLKNICDNLKTGGKLVFEFGGKDCAETVHAALKKSFIKRGLEYPRVFYFPTVGEYAPLVEQCGFVVKEAYLFDRPTPQKGDNGLISWINMFVKIPFDGIDNLLKNEIIQEAVEDVRNELLINGVWFVDYVRIRIKAVKVI